MRINCKYFLNATTVERKSCSSCPNSKPKTVQAVKCRMYNIVKSKTCDKCKSFEAK
jgi:hypothetical protein